MPIDAVPVDTAEASVEVVVVPSDAVGTLATVLSVGPRYRKPRPLQYWGSIAVLVVMVLLCFVGPHVLHLPGPNALDYTATSKGFFTKGHLLGTDELGRDLLARCLWGGQISIEVGISAVVIGMVIGSTLGTLAAYLGGLVDVVIMRIIDMFLAFPTLILALAIAAYLGPSERNEIIAISFFSITGYTRYTRAATLRLRSLDFLQSSEAIGAKTPRIIIRHIIPNIYGTVLTFAFLTVSGAMLLEAALSFLGAGIRPPEASWGNIISEGQSYLGTANQIILAPAIFLFVTVLSLNLLGDAIRVRNE
jgi:peptide/nickel transport system permease protein